MRTMWQLVKRVTKKSQVQVCDAHWKFFKESSLTAYKQCFQEGTSKQTETDWRRPVLDAGGKLEYAK